MAPDAQGPAPSSRGPQSRRRPPAPARPPAPEESPMCTLIALWRVVDGYDLVVGMNRDESANRPSEPPSLREGDPVLGSPRPRRPPEPERPGGGRCPPAGGPGPRVQFLEPARDGPPGGPVLRIRRPAVHEPRPRRGERAHERGGGRGPGWQDDRGAKPRCKKPGPRDLRRDPYPPVEVADPWGGGDPAPLRPPRRRWDRLLHDPRPE